MKCFILLLVLIFSSSSVYTQWQLQNSGTSENLNDVAILNQTTAVIVGNSGKILKTTNSGKTWVQKNSETTNHLNAVSLSLMGEGIAVGNGVICLTTDNGESWSDSSINNNAVSVYYYVSVYFGWNIIIGCDDGTIYFSSDAGETWQDTLLVNEPVIASGCVWYFPLGNENALFSTNSYTAVTGLPAIQFYPWNIYDNPISVGDNLTCGELSYDDQYLIGVGNGPGFNLLLLKKFKLDTVWVPIYSSIPVQFTPEDLAIYYDYNLFICGSDGKIFTSADDGVNWVEQTTGVYGKLNSIIFGYNVSAGYSVGDNGTILFTSNGGGINSVDETYQPTKVYLYQNYPNPFNPSTIIEYEINTRQYVQLKIYDLLGNEIANLVDDEQEAGTYNIEFNISKSNGKVVSGIYFYQLSGTGEDGESVQTRKMLYLK
ncbi:MAG: YCF48-related protein [Ignavibacteriaceae bacterium]|jgi:hypothetical protein|nr:YCF48-related protein [Ignavibacteriaceae bacterium]